MAAPTPYALAYDFTSFQSSNPTTPLPADKIEIEFNALQTTTDEIITNLGLIQKSDGSLANESVGANQLKSELVLGLNTAVDWATSTAYVVNDVVYENDNIYRCLEVHTSGVFATDLSASKWLLVVNFNQFTTATAADAVSTAADAVSTAADAVSTAADAAAVAANVALVPLSNYTAVAAPTVGDDSGDGYSVGSRWYYGSSKTMYLCLDATVGAAVWVDTSGGQIDVKLLGAKGDGTTDDTVAIQAAETLAGTVLASGNYLSVYFPPGRYLMGDVDWGGKTLWHATDLLTGVQLVYTGTGGAGTYMVGFTAGAGAIPSGGFRNIQFRGYDDADASGNICQNIWKNNGISFDWGFVVDNVQVMQCYGDAIDLFDASDSFINLFMNKVRFDQIGGFCIKVNSLNSNSGSPFVLDQFTMDNTLSSAFATRAQALGYYDGTHWGKGILDIEDGRDCFLVISNARIELNKPMVVHDGGTALIYSNNTLSSTQCRITVKNICGTGRNNQDVVMVRDTTGRTDFFSEGVQMTDLAMLFVDDTDSDRNINGRFFSPVQYSPSSLQQDAGINLNGMSIEARLDSPSQNNIFKRYKFGDIVHRRGSGTKIAGRPLGWYCVHPKEGFAVGVNDNITTSASCTASDADISVAGSLFSTMHVGLAITLVGAGAAAADYDTYITAVDPVGDTVTVDTAPSTTVGTLTIKYDQAEFAPYGYVQGIETRGDSNATLNLGVDGAPTQVWNTTLTANRTVTLTASSASSLGTVAQAHGKFRIARPAAGAFTLDVGGLKSLAADEWCEVEFDGSTWVLTAFGSL